MTGEPAEVYDLDSYRIASEQTTELPALRVVPERRESSLVGPVVLALTYLAIVAFLVWIALGK